VLPAGARTFTDTGRSRNTTYHYRLYAYTTGGYSPRTTKTASTTR